MEIVTRKVDELIPYENNPRKNDDAVKCVKASIEQFGFKVPIVIDAQGVIVAGHTRLKAAKELGMKEVPCIVADDLTDEQVRAYRLADNKTAEMAEWDIELLDTELLDLEANFDMTEFGFEIEPPPAVEIEDDGFDADAAMEEIDEPITKRGDIWNLGKHRLMCGDSTNPRDIDTLFSGKVARMCITDPPWNVAIGLDSNPRHRQRDGLVNDNMTSADFAKFLDMFVAAVSPHLDGDMYCCLGASEWPTLDKALRGNGYHWSGTIIWVKDAFVLGRSNYHRRYEPLWYGWKDGKTSSYNGERNLDDVWEFKRPRVSKEHPTMKPIELWAEGIKNSSKPNDVIVDPFGGSGTAIIAAEQLGRSAYSMEIDPKYCDVIIKRWESLTGQKAVLLNG